MNLTAPCTEPYGTLHWTGMGWVSVPFIEKTCVRSARYEENHCSAEPQTTNLRWSTVSRVGWSTVSNAAFRPNRTRAAICFSSTARTRSLIFVNVVVCCELLVYFSDKKSCNTSTTLQNNVAQFVSDSWASCSVCEQKLFNVINEVYVHEK